LKNDDCAIDKWIEICIARKESTTYYTEDLGDSGIADRKVKAAQISLDVWYKNRESQGDTNVE